LAPSLTSTADERALEIFEKALPAGHPDIAGSLTNLADLYRAQGPMSLPALRLFYLLLK
jgi:hypothetical protein